jgi:hypothetical protein
MNPIINTNQKDKSKRIEDLQDFLRQHAKFVPCWQVHSPACIVQMPAASAAMEPMAHPIPGPHSD